VLINLDIFYLLFIFLYIRFVVFVYRLVNKVDQIISHIGYPVLRVTSRSHLQSIVSRSNMRFRLIVILTLPDPN